MRAAILTMPQPIAKHPLHITDVPRPELEPGHVLLKVRACGVCRTDLHIVEGELTSLRPQLIPGHQIVGDVVEGATADLPEGTRVGVSWIGGTDGTCWYCRSRMENLCDAPTFTGYSVNGGYAEYALARADFVFPLPAALDDLHAAPLLCAGIIGFRSLRVAGSRTRRARRPVRLRRFRASGHRSSPRLEVRCLRLHARRLASPPGRVDGREMGGHGNREAARRTRPRHHLRAQRRRGGRRARQPAQRRSGRHQRHSPRPHAAVRLRHACCGASARSAASPT